MYLPKHFNESRPEVLHALIREYPLGLLVAQTASGIEVNHIPFIFAGDATSNGSLLGHVSRQNGLWQLSEPGEKALVVFQGPSAYISPSWYPTKKEHGRVVPTWNYAVVQAQGTLRIHDDPDWVARQVDRLTSQMESSMEFPWAASDMPPEFQERMINSIVGVELVIDTLVGKWKVSQNHPPANRAGAIEGLIATGRPAAIELAQMMRIYTADGE
jgi:transcriptional regulator